MAPEQALGSSRAVGAAADVYALGAILYELLTGRPPFRGMTMLDTLEQVRSQEPIPPGQLQPKVPRDLETICLKCLQKASTNRYASAADLAQDLRRYLGGLPVSARPTPLWERGLKWARRRPGVAALLALILFVVAGSFTGVFALWRQAEHRRQQAEENRDNAKAEDAFGQEARQHEEEAHRDALFQRNQARALLAQSSASLYYTNVSRALRERRRNETGITEELLDQCPQKLCQWEWYYLKRLCQASVLALPGGEHVAFFRPATAS